MLFAGARLSSLACPRPLQQRGDTFKKSSKALDVADEQPEGVAFLIPVRLEECEMPQRLEQWHWVDLFEDGGYERLVRVLRGPDRRVAITVLTEAQRVQLGELVLNFIGFPLDRGQLELLAGHDEARQAPVGSSAPAVAHRLVERALDRPNPALLIRILEQVDPAGTMPELAVLASALRAEPSRWRLDPNDTDRGYRAVDS